MHSSVKWLLLLGVLITSFGVQGCFRSHVYRTPRLIVETIRTRRCFGKKKFYPCRYRTGHLRIIVLRCRRGFRTYTRKRRRIIRDARCRNHAFIGSRRSREIIP